MRQDIRLDSDAVRETLRELGWNKRTLRKNLSLSRTQVETMLRCGCAGPKAASLILELNRRRSGAPLSRHERTSRRLRQLIGEVASSL